MKETIIYFEKPGKVNTPEVLSLVKERAQARAIRKVVLASTSGKTAMASVEAFEGSGIELAVIPWQFGFMGKQHPFPPELVTELKEKGHQVHFGTMLFHTDDLYGIKTPTVMADLLRIFGQGTKVCVEIIMMACDGGCVEIGETVIAVAGTMGGADTAVVATAAPSTKLTRLRIHEIICKPLLVKTKKDSAEEK